ncbi:MAG: mannose-1-phosphate guanylyltransferase, partial [Bacteroidota bacterium]
FERFLPLCPAEQIYVVTNAQYRDLVKEHLPELSDQQILCEPSRNNTAPCVAYAAFKLNQLNPEANMIVAPADHLITKEEAFLDRIRMALDFADRKNALLTLGIQPNKPHTGYGYIQFKSQATEGDVHEVAAFTEKPNVEKAQVFLDSGDYVWNAGIFIWKTKSVLKAFQEYATEIYDILKTGEGVYNSSGEQAFINQAYPTTPSISIDYAIMEKANNVYTIPADIGWSDLGTWDSIYQLMQKDQQQNAVSGVSCHLLDAKDNMIHGAKDKLVVVKGIKDFIIVDDDDVLLIYPKSDEQGIKQVINTLKDNGKQGYL